jgi:hypothetical protein
MEWLLRVEDQQIINSSLRQYLVFRGISLRKVTKI